MTSARTRPVVALLTAAAVALSVAAGAQERGRQRRPPPRPPVHVAVRGELVFVGGYFYDPFFGPYPWWRHEAYPYRYAPPFDHRAIVRLQVTPKTASVYVDGFYAGIVDDFDGVFQGLPLTPGGHTIELYLPGFRTVRRAVYLIPGSSMRLHEALEPVGQGESPEPPTVSPPLPPPPDGTYRPPVTPPVEAPAARPGGVAPSAFGTLNLVVQPPTATVTIDGIRWASSDGGLFVVELPQGRHRVTASQPGYAEFSRDIDVRAGQVVPLNVSLARP